MHTQLERHRSPSRVCEVDTIQVAWVMAFYFQAKK
jgi:hypothetical protein